MNKKVLGGALLVLGLVLVVVGLVLNLVVVPGMKQFPDDVNTTRLYSGTMTTLLNPATFAFMHDIPVDLERHFETEATDGKLALVLEDQVLSAQGQTLLEIIKRHSINRKTMEFSSGYPSAWASTEGFVDRGGLVMGWPIDTKKKDYLGWSDDYGATVPLTFAREEEHPRAKINTYVFTSSSTPQPIVPAAVTGMGLPTELPQAQLAALIGGLDISPSIAAALPLVIKQANWPDPVPLTYTYEYTGEYWVEPATGVLIDTHKIEIRRVGVSQELLDALVARLADLPIEVDLTMVSQLIPIEVFNLEYQSTDQSVQDAKKDAEDAKSQIQLFGTIVPLAAIIIGVLMALAGAFVFTRKAA